jgi:hypothetical protein
MEITANDRADRYRTMQFNQLDTESHMAGLEVPNGANPDKCERLGDCLDCLFTIRQ